MRRSHLRLALIGAVLLAFALVAPRMHTLNQSVPSITPSGMKSSAADQATLARIQTALGQMPLGFTENQGQVDNRVAYYVQGHDTSLYFTDTGITFALTEPGAPMLPPAAGVESEPAPADTGQRWAVKLDFVGATGGVQPAGLEQTSTLVSYFKGARDQWRTGLPTYRQLIYADLWPGIDLVYAGTVNQLKYTFLVKPGADPSQIRLAYRGATSVRLNESGQLEIVTPAGSFTDEAPYSYQELDGRQVEVASAYDLDSSSASYGFLVDDYDRSRPLIVDPAVLLYAGYIGGAEFEAGSGITVDGAGNVYIVGSTESAQTSFPVAAGPDLTYNGGLQDAFVAKVKADGTGLSYAGYIGGNQDEQGFKIAVDSAGNAYVVGITLSGQASFPVLQGPDLTYNGGFDTFVAKINAGGTALDYAGYIGGGALDVGTGIALDSTGHAYVVGRSDQQSSSTFPLTIGPDLTYNGGDTDVFVAKVKADGSGLDYAGYIGGSGDDFGGGVGKGIAVDSDGNAYVVGTTSSTETSFPETVGPDLTHNGGSDAFVAKVKADGTGLDYAGYIGGTENEQANGVAVDAAGNAYITGSANSPQASFPVSVGPDLTFNDGQDAFVAKVKADGTSLDYAGYIGGNLSEGGVDIALDSQGNAYVTGNTFSSQAAFQPIDGPDLTYNGSGDAFIAKIAAAGTGFVYKGYLGGSNLDTGFGIAVDANSSVYLTGQTSSAQTSFPATGGPDITFNGRVDAYVAKIAELNRITYLPIILR